MSLLGQRLGVAVLLMFSVLALGARQTVLAQETDDPVKIEIYKRFVDNRAERPAVAYQAARDYLQSRGVDPGRMQTISWGKERPAVEGSSESAWAQNRRAVTVVPE